MPYNPDDLMVQCELCKDWYVSLRYGCCAFIVGAYSVKTYNFRHLFIGHRIMEEGNTK